MSFKFKKPKSVKPYKQQYKQQKQSINYFKLVLDPRKIIHSAFKHFNNNVALISYQELSHKLKLHRISSYQILSKKLPLLSKQFLIIYDFSKKFCCYHDNKKNILYTNQPKNEISKALIKLFNIKNQVQKVTNCSKEFRYLSKTKFNTHILKHIFKKQSSKYGDQELLKLKEQFSKFSKFSDQELLKLQQKGYVNFFKRLIDTILSCLSKTIKKYIKDYNIIKKIQEYEFRLLHPYIINNAFFVPGALLITDNKEKVKKQKFRYLNLRYPFLENDKNHFVPFSLTNFPSYMYDLFPEKIVYGVELSQKKIIDSLSSTDPKENKISPDNIKSIDIYYTSKNEWVNIKSKAQQKNKQKQRAFSLAGLPSYMKVEFLKPEKNKQKQRKKNKKISHNRSLTL